MGDAIVLLRVQHSPIQVQFGGLGLMVMVWIRVTVSQLFA